MSGLATSFVVALLAALVTTLAFERLARRAGLVVAPRPDRWHRTPVPLLGGIAIVVGVLTAPLFGGLPLRRFAGFLGVAVAMAGLGLFDDLRPLRPPVKLVGQIVLAGLLIHLGFLLRLTPYTELNVLLTLFWLVAITNAFNLLDNMDGLAAGMAVIAGAFRLGFFLLDGDVAGASLMAAFIGACLGFLVRNFAPARIFMGDAGSFFIGFFLSGVCLVGEYAYSRGVAAVLLFPVLLLLIPIFDTTFVTITRILTGRPVARGGRDHTSHRLVALGASERQVLLFLYGISVAGGSLALLSYQFQLTYTIALLPLLLLALVALGVHLSRVRAPDATAGVSAPVTRLVADFPFKRQAATVAIDLVLIFVAYYSAYLLRFEGGYETHRARFVQTVGPVLILQIASLALFGSYRGLWRYTGLADVLRLARGATAGTAAAVVYFVLSERFEGLSRAVFVLDWLLLVVLLAASRMSFRLLGELLRPVRLDSRRVLIYGAGDGGELTLRELRNNADLKREAIGFLDDDRSKVGTRIHDVPVLGSLDRVEEVLVTHQIGEVIVSSQKIAPDRMRALEAICATRRIPVARAAVRIEEHWDLDRA